MADDTQDKTEGRQIEKGSTKRGDHSKNPVISDRICKEVILRDKKFRRDWPRKYGHLTNEFFKRVLAEECRKKGLPADSFERKPPEDAIKRSPIPLKPSPSIPRTTSGMVGFRSSHPEYNLEFTGRWYISPKWTIEPPIEPGEFRVTQQRFIFLG
ncbi:uncharacterized protein C20orf85-like [Hylaeus anthracinus]|uniref:uncharacterized protein C20orf85-like n=1 Tax=Hylaeus volcanicus TaxID=313075 RepID=UPI0023B86AC4|nr:uncharacterized protein C20orf85-like [Hylaeus volcanicus]XP_054013818.1 uncharacterized protein C20orf85-like [Hylaeus anthracinus]